jgi:hypothetical protein
VLLDINVAEFGGDYRGRLVDQTDGLAIIAVQGVFMAGFKSQLLKESLPPQDLLASVSKS